MKGRLREYDIVWSPFFVSYGAMPSTMSCSIRWSLRLAAEMSTCSGSPLRSPNAWILELGLPRSTGLGPVRGPF